jgi:hypothetical protein
MGAEAHKFYTFIYFITVERKNQEVFKKLFFPRSLYIVTVLW